MPRKAKRYDVCQVMRRKLVKHFEGFDNAAAGIVKTEEWVTEVCGIPLFNDVDSLSGVCRSCREGWTHPHNYKVED